MANISYEAKQLGVTQQQMSNYKAVAALNHSMSQPGQGGGYLVAEYGGPEAVLGDKIMDDFYKVSARIKQLQSRQAPRAELSDIAQPERVAAHW